MSMNSDNFVGLVAILCIFGLPLVFAIIHRYLSHQERIEMIRRGMTPPPDSRWARKMRKRGWGGAGFDMPPPGNFEPAYDPYAYGLYQANRQLQKGIRIAMIGLAITVGLSFAGGQNSGSPSGPIGPVILAGLIPLFVGVAQIVTAMLSGARLGPWGFGAGMPPGPGQQPSMPFGQGAPFTADRSGAAPGPYTWRPGATTELERPIRPPDTQN